MKTYLRIGLLTVLGLAMFFALSCTKDEKPTTPNFEEPGISSHIWDYKHVVWFNLNYFEPTKGIANVDIFMTAKGDAPDATLRIGTQDIEFPYVTSYTDGKIYAGGEININTDQPVSYLITNDDKTYEGSISVLPHQIDVSAWPTFAQNTNYSPTWSIDPEPDFHVIDSMIWGENAELDYIRQIDGDVMTYTLLQSEWASLLPVQEFVFGINAIGYEMKNSNNVLIVGQTDNYYDWALDKRQPANRPAMKPFRYMDRIIEDINK